MTILKDVANEAAGGKEKNEASPAKKPGGGVEEHVLLLQETMCNLCEKSEETDWEEKYKQLVDVLAEKNIMNFMAGVDICDAFLVRALRFHRPFVETHLIELMQPIIKK